MFCRYCGKELKNDAVVCTGCGRAVEGHADKKWSFVAFLALLVATLFFPPVGLVAGALSLRSEAGKVQGAVLLTISIFISLLVLAIVLGL